MTRVAIRLMPIVLLASCEQAANEPTADDIDDPALREASVAVGAVHDAFTPSSLSADAIGLSQGRVRQSMDPCEGVAGPLECQPILLRLYYDLAKARLDNAQGRLNDIFAEIGVLTTTTTAVSGSAGGYDYSYTHDGTTIHLLVADESPEPNVYIVVTDGDVTIRTVGEGEVAGSVSTEEVVIEDYQDDENWTATVFWYGRECMLPDFRAPERIAISVARTGDVWVGQAVTYSERFLEQAVTCDAPVTDDTALNLYTGFVGSELAAKGELFLVPRDEQLPATADEFEAMFGLPDGCDVFDACPDAENPFCTLPTVAEPMWNDDCTDDDPSVATTDFADYGDWRDPAAFYQSTIEIPASL